MSSYKDPNRVLHCHILGTRAAAFLFLGGSAVCLLRARGGGIPSALGFQEGMRGHQRALASDVFRWEIGGTTAGLLINYTHTNN